MKTFCNGAIICPVYTLFEEIIMLVSRGALSRFIKSILRRNNKIQKACNPVIFVGSKPSK